VSPGDDPRRGPPSPPSAGSVPPFHQAPQRWAVLALLSLALLLGMSEWFTATAVAPQLQERWALSAPQVSALTVWVQWGFVAGTALAALLNLADVVPSRVFFAVCAVGAAAANAALLLAPGFGTGAGLRFLTGLFLAGVYPPAMKMIATWFRSARGLAIGTVVGALTVGKAVPYLLKAVGGTSLGAVILGTSTAGLAASLLVLFFYRDGPHAFPSRPFAWSRVGELLRHPPTMLATGGYLGHMWELYAMWTLVPAFFVAALAGRGLEGSWLSADLLGFAVIAAGGAGAVLAGRWADALGRERITIWAMATSGGCALVVGWMVAAPLVALIPLALLWGFSVVADSAQFSAVVTEVAPGHAVGTALTLQTALGFALTGFSIDIAGRVVDSSGWGPGFSLLAAGPVLGILSMTILRRRRARESAAR
jgi:sugar phosphate permease